MTPRVRHLALLGLTAAALAIGAASLSAITVPSAGPGAVLLAAGDIASCSSDGDEATAALVAREPAATVATLGDNVYPQGTLAQYTSCYGPSWGQHKARTRPAAGNHEYRTDGALGYFDYFGSAAGERGKGYYSYNLGTWHVVVLNSSCTEVGGCDVGSPQEQWLRADLAAHPSRCTLAYWHHPRFSSGRHGNEVGVEPFWRALYDAGADVILSAHDHHYERFARQGPTGQADAQGPIQFLVGTGGKSNYLLGQAEPNSVVSDDASSGVLRLALGPSSFSWRFLPAVGHTFTDAGSANCVNRAAPSG